MAMSLHEGDIEAAPLMTAPNRTACDYCDYSAVCGHEKQDGFRPIFDGDPWEAMEAIDNG